MFSVIWVLLFREFRCVFVIFLFCVFSLESFSSVHFHSALFDCLFILQSFQSFIFAFVGTYIFLFFLFHFFLLNPFPLILSFIAPWNLGSLPLSLIEPLFQEYFKFIVKGLVV